MSPYLFDLSARRFAEGHHERAHKRMDRSKFVILTTGRSGSNLIVRGLAAHPEVLAFAEILAQGAGDRQKALSGSGAAPLKEGDAADEYLRRVIYDFKWPDDVKAVGFKLLFDQSRHNPHHALAWRYLVASRSIKVIHVIRENLLDCALSFEIARKTGEWFRELGTPTPATLGPIELTEAYCHWFFRRADLFNRGVAHKFKHHAYLRIDFEGVTNNYATTMDRIFDFVDVSRKPSTPLLVKQSSGPTADRICNFAAIKKEFAQTKYAKYFG